jgi:hypothetical protein
MNILKFSLFNVNENATSIDLGDIKDPDKPIYNNNNIIQEICISMVLLNPAFLDKILDAGQSARYKENSQVLLTDLKTLLLSKNRLCFGKFVDNKCVEDDESALMNQSFEGVEFDIIKNWDKLVSARTTARNIVDKLVPGEKLKSDDIQKIYWIGPNKTKAFGEDLVIELNDNRQFSFFINKSLSMSKSSSFNTFADEMLGTNTEKMYAERNIEGWDKLVQNYVTILYENANSDIQLHIEKYIDVDRISSLSWFEYFEISHSNSRYKHLGEYISEFDKNISKFSDLMNEIWKNRDICFIDPVLVFNKWMKSKIFILNSRILEHTFTEALTQNNSGEVTKLEDGFKLADGTVKMKLIKTIVNKLGSLERPSYYLGANGKSFIQAPSRNFFRETYDQMSVKFDYHVKMLVDEDEEDNNDFIMRIHLELDNEILLSCFINVDFSGGLSSKLKAKYHFDLASDFNDRVSAII